MSVVSGSFGLFSGVSVINSTGASMCSRTAHDSYLPHHFVPLSTTSYA